MKNKENSKWKVILFSILFCWVIFFVTDMTMASNNQKPVFMLKFNTYLDGGTTVYYGLGYKVIQYNVLDGRKDTEMGTWFLKYDSRG